MRCCCALAAACICLFAVQGAIAPTRACAQSDWRFSFGVCHEGLRHIYPYTQRCDETKSPVKPSPLFNVSCHKTCPAGTHLAAKLRNGLTVLDCVECKPGYFSLGGGLLISGQAGDWHRSWPPGLRTGCSYRRLDGSWHTDGASTTGLTTGVCQIQILSPPTVAGAYYIRATHTRSKGTRSPTGVALFVLAPGDRRLCSRISGNLHPQASGFTGQRPGPSQADNGRRSLNFWLLAAAGGCSYDRKAQVAGMAGAQGVVLAPAAILDIGAGPHGLPEHSPGRDNVSRTVPIYEFLDSQDAQVLAAALRVRPKGHAEMILNDTAVQLCSEPEPSALPEMGTPGNVTYGCNAWTPDELGNSIHSGDNRNFNRMVSSLELSVNIVRKEGYVVFRYQVDAEEGYDGFSFEVDWKEAMPSTSSQRNWTDVRINLTKGAHVLRWQYAKDYSGYTGMDRAQLQLVQVVGTQYADLECFHCHGSGMHSIGGADHCNACLRNQYLSAGRSASLARCQPCPAGKWSVPGSVSAASCVTAEKCTSESVKVALSPCQSGRQHQVRSWILPVICDVNDSSAAALLQGAAGDQECVPCEPNTYRPNNAECVPKTISCPAGNYAVTELVLSRWEEWPKNLSQEVIGPHEEVTGTADVPGGWALNNGSLHMTLGVGGIHITDKLEARLHLDVQVTLSPGRVNFTLELPSAVMWADMRFLVDGVVSSNIPGFHVEQLPRRAQHVTRFQVTGPLWPGRHRLTWSCSHSLLGADLRRLRLVRVAVQGAANAGASECAPCPAGQEVAPNGASCRSCPPGHFLAKVASSTRCTACNPGKFSDTWAATDCRECGAGTTAGFGAITCDPQPILLTRDFAAASKVLTPGEVVINVTSAIQRWRAATEGVTGPLLVAGRKFYISLMRPAPPPGDEGGMAYVWEQVSRQDCDPADHGGSSVGGGAASSLTAAAPPPAVVPLGVALASVEAVALGSLRGVRFTWKKEASLQLQPKMAVLCPDAATMSAEALSGFSLLLRCDTAARIPEPPARSDAAGNAHLEHLRLAERPIGAFEPYAVCGMLELQWPTVMACPPCQAQDFGAQLGKCDEEQMRFVTFKLMRPCIGGMAAPPGYKESCAGDNIKSIAKHVGKVVKEQYPMRATIVSVAAVLLGCTLICYATHLHRSYRQRFLQDGL